MKLPVSLVCLALAVLAPADALAKGVDAIVVVGSGGRSVRIGPDPAILSVVFYNPASVYKIRPKPSTPLGGYVKVYPLGRGGFPAKPGRFYPATRALCFSWTWSVARGSCSRLAPPRRLLAASRQLSLFHGKATTRLTRTQPAGTLNLIAALELAFDRYRAARSAPRPVRCLAFLASWSGPLAEERPRRVCVFGRGVYARGRIYLGPAIWKLALEVS